MSEMNMDIPKVRKKRRDPQGQALLISMVLSVVVSLLLHGLLVLALGKVQISVPLTVSAVREQIAEEVDWFVMFRQEESKKKDTEKDGASGRLSQHERKSAVNDSRLESERMELSELPAPVVPDDSDKLDLPKPELSDEDLDKAFKTVQLTGVEVEKRVVELPEIVSAVVPKVESLMPETDDFLSVPDVVKDMRPQAMDDVKPKEVVPSEANGKEFQRVGGGVSPVVLPSESGGSGWSISYIQPSSGEGGHGGRASGVAPLSGGDAGGTVRGNLDIRTGKLAGGAVGGRGGGRPSAVLGVKVRLGTGIEFDVPDSESEEAVEMEQPSLVSDTGLVQEVRLKEGGEAIESSVPLEAFVNVTVRVSREETGGGYYEVLIEPNEKCDELTDVAKDVLFIIDHSGSIQPGRLSQFKAITRQALSYLNARDRFNVVTFTSRSSQLFKEFAPPTPKNIEAAHRRIRSLMCNGQTDVFGGIGPYVAAGNGDMSRPVIVFVMTDGQSTIKLHRGKVEVDNRKVNDVLRQIVLANKGNVSIYPFSAGSDTDRVLLDFLARLNGGFPRHVLDGAEFRNELSTYMRTHMSLMVSDFRYIAEGRISENIYPRSLPNLYRNEPLAIYGRFESLNDTLVLTLLGNDAQGKLRNLVFKRRFSDCEEYKSVDAMGVSLREQWTAQKALHLLADWVVSHDPGKAETHEARRRRQELNKLLGTITAFSKYSELLKN